MTRIRVLERSVQVLDAEAANPIFKLFLQRRARRAAYRGHCRNALTEYAKKYNLLFSRKYSPTR